MKIEGMWAAGWKLGGLVSGLRRALVCGLVACGLVACGCGESSVTLAGDESEFDFFIEPDTGYFIVDTDVPVATHDAAREWSQMNGRASDALTVASSAAGDAVWPKSIRQHLSYCVDRASFGADASSVINALERATRDWEEAANVSFEHRASEDTHCDRFNAKVLFNVRGVSRGSYLARAFLPTDPRAMRELVITASALPPKRPLTLAGVIRHELGHTLGLRHEHTRMRNNPCYEDSQWRAVTTYDDHSVMHYPQCRGSNSGDLLLTASDKRGIRSLYP